MVAEERDDGRAVGFFQFFGKPSEFAVGAMETLDVVFQRQPIVLRKERRLDVDFVVGVFVALIGKMVFHRNGENESRLFRFDAVLQFGKDAIGQNAVRNEFSAYLGAGHVFQSDELFESEERVRSRPVEEGLMVGVHRRRGISGGTEFERHRRNRVPQVLLVRDAAVRKPGDRSAGEHFELDEGGLASEHGRNEIPSPVFQAEFAEIGNRVFREFHSGELGRIPERFAQYEHDVGADGSR